MSTATTTHVPAPFQIPVTLMTDLQKLEPLITVCIEIHDLAREIRTKHLVGKLTDSDHKIVAWFMFAKSFKTFQSIVNLCLSGCGADALSLCAGLFENMVDMLYIGQAPLRRPARYIQFEQVDKFYQIRKILSRKRLPQGWRKRYKDYEATVSPVATKYLKHFKNRNGWSQKSIADRAQAVGCELEYRELYYILCAIKHTSPAGSVTVVTESVKGPEPIYGPNIKGVYDACLYGGHYFLRICAIFQRVFTLHLESQIKTLDEKLAKSAAKVYEEHREVCD